jgi:hypothetical protein
LWNDLRLQDDRGRQRFLWKDGFVSGCQVQQPSLDERVSVLGHEATMRGALFYKLAIHYTHPWTQQTHTTLLVLVWLFKQIDELPSLWPPIAMNFGF